MVKQRKDMDILIIGCENEFFVSDGHKNEAVSRAFCTGPAAKIINPITHRLETR